MASDSAASSAPAQTIAPIAPARTIYLVGSLKNPNIPVVAGVLRNLGFDVFDDWFAAGEEADDIWQRYEIARGRTYRQALAGYHAAMVFDFDRTHLDRADAGVLVLPAGKSAHMEIGYLRGQNKPTFVLFDGEPARFEIMYRFHTVAFSVSELVALITEALGKRRFE